MTAKRPSSSFTDFSPEAERLGVPEDENFADGSAMMMSHIAGLMGTRWCGIVNRVPDTLYIATLFFHFCWIPLAPLQSWIVVIDLRGSRTAASRPIGWHLGSILTAWMRTGLTLVALALGLSGLGGLLGAMMGANGILLPVVLTAAGGAVGVMLWYSHRLGDASGVKAETLALRAGFTADEAEAIATAVRFGVGGEKLAGVACPQCGRELAGTTRVCPRCEARL